MAQTLRRVKAFVALLFVLFWAGPLALALPALLLASLPESGWPSFVSQPFIVQQLFLSLMIGSAAAIGAVALALFMVLSRGATARFAGLMLAVPHLAFAIGLSFLIMPTGLLARLLAFSTPPDWVSVQDPHGLALISALILKETPFLLWLFSQSLSRRDFGTDLQLLRRQAESLGHGPGSVALRVAGPLLLRQFTWPIIIVWSYGCSTIDMALVIGPLQPSPLQLSIWRDLNDASSAMNAKAAAGALAMTLCLASLLLAARGLARWGGTWARQFMAAGPSSLGIADTAGRAIHFLLVLIYAAVLVVLVMFAFSSRWPFPDLLPHASLASWERLASAWQPLANSLRLAFLSSFAALTLALLWFETMPRSYDLWVGLLAVFALSLPAVSLAAGQYELFIKFGLDGGYLSVWLAQLTPVFAYVFIALAGPYRSFDQRYLRVSQGLGRAFLAFLLQVKWPLLKAPLAAAAAIGLAVSLGQYVSVQLIGGGAIPTLTTEAITLASGGNRPLLAVYALALTALASLCFGAASFLGRRA